MMPPLITGLLKPAAYPHPANTPRLIETHISWVILAGEFAYKIKKPLDLGFLDFSSLDKRRHFCEEEIRLNTRLAPDIYLGVVAITGTPEEPLIEGTGAAIEWAVKMRAFPADATLDREPEITIEQIDAIADRIAAFHENIAIAPAESAYGAPESVSEPVAVNFAQLRKLLPLLDGETFKTLLDRLQTWSQTESERLAVHFIARKTNGYIRECHGDLHMGNIAWVDGKPLIFDALEFNPALRHIDVISEIAFLAMDLRHRDRDDLAWRLLNRYLDQTGDIDGLAALPYYQVYRALVRAKVAAIQASQAGADFAECLRYLELANRLAHDRRPALVLMHGVSGSGKTWLSQHLLEQLGGIRLRSDVTRKRLFGLKPLQDSSADFSNTPGGIYTQAASARTLTTLLDAARASLAAGFLTLVDATFIHRTWRAPFQALAEEIGIAWQIVSVEAPSDVLRARIAQRRLSGADASEADQSVLDSQLANLQPFSPEESVHVLHLGSGWTVADAIAQLRAALNIQPKP
ncbi:MAG: hypothetical protein B7Y41_10590 [Hydrogenophilales bacterium 28-61-23]|nr:MAG: hypothetical protein B7Y41_10590 [Hydrogenophilales bacterium 28-61-23]